MNADIRQGLFGRWYLSDPNNAFRGWSGSRWVDCTLDGYPTAGVQVCNFETREAAEEYVAKENRLIGGTYTTRVLIAQSDDPELLEWLAKADQYGGTFVHSLARAALVADEENYAILRPVLLAMRSKYPQYEPSAAVKQEIRERQEQGDGRG